MEQGITLSAENIITIAAVITALGVIFGAIFTVYRWYLKIEHQKVEIEKLQKEIKRLKEEDALIIYALSACLDGLEQLGANHSVPKAKDKLDKYINQQAHQ